MRKILFCIFLIANIACIAQKKSKVKFGDVSIEDLSKSIYEIDSSAEAVVLYDYGNVKYEGDNRSDFNVIYKYHMRIKLLNKNSFERATVHIPLSKYNNMEEKIEKFEAATYNIENGKVVVTKVDRGSIFKDKVSKNAEVQKFTFPNVTEGSIIEYMYTVSSPYSHNIKSWSFQGKYPSLWSEYDLTVPSVFNFSMIKKGYHSYTIDTIEISNDNYTILIPSDFGKSEVVNFKSNTYHNTWAMKNIPALKVENYITTLDNHIAGLDFELASIKFPNSPVRNVIKTWNETANDLLKNEYFGLALSEKNSWLDDDLNSLKLDKDSLASAKKIYAFVRDNFTAIGGGSIYLSAPLKKTYQAKKGNIADANILLATMLVHKGYNAKPVLLSTRDNGKAFESYAILNRFNYVVCKLRIDTTDYILDASSKKIGFNRLPSYCYNGSARTIDKQMPILIPLEADKINESKISSIVIENDKAGNMVGTFNSKLGYFESVEIRQSVKQEETSDYFKNIQKKFLNEVLVDSGRLEEYNEYDEPINMTYNFKFGLNDEDVIYFNPMLTESIKSNPFKSETRFYPVEMPYAVNDVYIFSMEVPKGYKVDEMPKSVRVNYNEDEGVFEYIIKETNGVIQMRCRLKLNKSTFPFDEYETLRDFYGYVVKKQSEQIVFKKIK